MNSTAAIVRTMHSAITTESDSSTPPHAARKPCSGQPSKGGATWLTGQGSHRLRGVVRTTRSSPSAARE